MQKLHAGNRERVADMLCLVVGAIWGAGFIASQKALDAHMSPSLIMFLRFAAAALVTLVVCLPRLRNIRARDLGMGALAGAVLFSAFFTQIVGQRHTAVSHSAFLTSTNVIMVPFIVWAVSRKAPPLHTFFFATVTLCGAGLLTAAPGQFSLSFNFGDALTLLCAFLFALHIAILGWATKGTDPALINLVQLSVAALLSAAAFFVTDGASFAGVDWSAGLPAALYLGLFSTCLCYFLQTYAQKYTPPSHAGVLLSTEGFFGSLFSVLLGFEPLTAGMALGGALILFSVIMTEIFSARADANKREE